VPTDEQRPQEHVTTTSGGQFIGSNVGGHGNEVRIDSLTVGGTTDATDRLLDQLRTELAELRRGIVALPQDDAGDVAAAREDVEELITAVAVPRPDGKAARSRWASLLGRIPASFKDAGNLTKIAGLMVDLGKMLG
jgi:hypothetical protein